MELTLDFARVKSVVENYSSKVETLIDNYTDRKDQLIALLHDVQAEFNYLPRDVLLKISQKLDIPMTDIFSVATFYKVFSLEPRGRHMLTVCTGTACHVRGGQRLVGKMERDFKVRPGETTEDLRFSFNTANCLGCCALGPVAVIDGKYESQVNPDKLGHILKEYL